jgi:hypothetical protein
MRYLRTYDNKSNDKVVARIFGCEDCPLMGYDRKTDKSFCRTYKDKKNSNVIKLHTEVYYMGSVYSFEYLEIPDWCNLPIMMGDLLNDKTIFFITDDDVYIHSFVTKEYELPFVLVKKSVILTTGEVIEDYSRVNVPGGIFIKNDTQNNPIVICCPSCKKTDDKINKKINLGLCNDCWEVVKKDEKLFNTFYINNFRSKRNIKPIDGEIKILSELKNYHE